MLVKNWFLEHEKDNRIMDLQSQKKVRAYIYIYLYIYIYIHTITSR